MTGDGPAPPVELLDAIGNLARFHHQHELFYAQAPLRQALDLQASSHALKALASRWRDAQPEEHPVPVPFTGAEDLNAPGLVSESGILFMIEPGARDKRGLRQWLAERSGEGRTAAAFDTRLDRSPALTGVAARGIARRLHGGGYELMAKPESFLVEDAEGSLAPGALERARAWGAKLAATAQA